MYQFKKFIGLRIIYFFFSNSNFFRRNQSGQHILFRRLGNQICHAGVLSVINSFLNILFSYVLNTSALLPYENFV